MAWFRRWARFAICWPTGIGETGLETEAASTTSRRVGPRALVAQAVAGGAEVAVGVKFDAKFGPMVTFGSGGVLVEVMRDLCAMLAPVGAGEVRDAVRKSRSWKLLNGYRGSRPADIE